MTFGNAELEPVFVIPTYRLRDVPETVRLYDENFHTYGRSVDIWVFDDSPSDLHERHVGRLSRIPTFNDVYIVGHPEKTRFLDYLMSRTGITMANTIIARTFRPSYGGNRNFSLVYTLGRRFISSDDDMRPGGYVLKSRRKLKNGVVLRGRMMPSTESATFTDYDVVGAFLDVLGKNPATLGLDFGEFVEDSNYDLQTNRRKPNTNSSKETQLHLRPIQSPETSQKSSIRLARSFISGVGDMDSEEILEMFLNSSEKNVSHVTESFVVEAFRPFSTEYSWNFAAGVSGYDHTDPLPPFFPTNLRFEDYSFRLWAQRRGIASAHVNAVQHHARSPYMRAPLVKDIMGEYVAAFLKDKLRGPMEDSRDNDFTMRFGYNGVVRKEETDQVLQRLRELYERIGKRADAEHDAERREALLQLRARLKYEAMDFDSDNFLNRFSGIIDDEVYVIKDCMDYWQTILEITHLRMKQRKLPITKVANPRR